LEQLNLTLGLMVRRTIEDRTEDRHTFNEWIGLESIDKMTGYVTA